jgi:hypothetical protein
VVGTLDDDDDGNSTVNCSLQRGQVAFFPLAESGTLKPAWQLVHDVAGIETPFTW